MLASYYRARLRDKGFCTTIERNHLPVESANLQPRLTDPQPQPYHDHQ